MGGGRLWLWPLLLQCNLSIAPTLPPSEEIYERTNELGFGPVRCRLLGWPRISANVEQWSSGLSNESNLFSSSSSDKRLLSSEDTESESQSKAINSGAGLD